MKGKLMKRSCRDYTELNSKSIIGKRAHVLPVRASAVHRRANSRLPVTVYPLPPLLARSGIFGADSPSVVGEWVTLPSPTRSSALGSLRPCLSSRAIDEWASYSLVFGLRPQSLSLLSSVSSVEFAKDRGWPICVSAFPLPSVFIREYSDQVGL